LIALLLQLNHIIPLEKKKKKKMSARIITDSDFSHLLTAEQRQQATKEVIVELTDEIKALKENADRDQRELVKTWGETETLADEVETLKDEVETLKDEVETLKEEDDLRDERDTRDDRDERELHAEFLDKIDTLKLCVADRDEHAETLKDEIKTLQKMNINFAKKNINACAEIKALKEQYAAAVRWQQTLSQQALRAEMKRDKEHQDIIDYMKTTEDSGKCGDNLNAFSSILGTLTSPRFTTLYNNNLHFAFEKADNRQDTEWFKKANPLYSDFFAHHMKMTAGVFEWSFYEAFLTQNEK
tara:strand:+ start:455 stop:1354 length:900 start_codon:yes stop_codon:yes gene_type:complete